MAPTTRSVSVRLNGRVLPHVPSVHAPLNGDYRITKHNAPRPLFVSGNRGRPHIDRWRPEGDRWRPTGGGILDRSRPRRRSSLRESSTQNSVLNNPKEDGKTGYADDVQITDSVISSSPSSLSTSPEDKPEEDEELEEGEVREYGKSSQSSQTTPSPRRSPLWEAIHAWEAHQSSPRSGSTPSSQSSFQPRWDFEIVDQSRCLPGVVFQTAYHTAMGSAARASADNLTETTRGYVYTKYRKFVILEKHATHIQALPIYTHNGTGLDHKRHFEHEFVCVRDRDCPADEREPEEGVNGTLYGIREPGFKATFIRGRSVLKLTEMVSFSMGGLLARVEGRLEGESLRALACLAHNVRAKCLEDVFLLGGGD